VDTVLGIATSTASVAAHLHDRGLLLGDLYAHNILHHPDGRCVITDFGGATLLPVGDGLMMQTMERIEVRAFGILLEELLYRCVTPAGEEAAIGALWALQARCVAPPAARPHFAEVMAALQSIVR
jgi:serine/threonine protein kinase